MNTENTGTKGKSYKFGCCLFTECDETQDGVFVYSILERRRIKVTADAVYGIKIDNYPFCLLCSEEAYSGGKWVVTCVDSLTGGMIGQRYLSSYSCDMSIEDLVMGSTLSSAKCIDIKMYRPKTDDQEGIADAPQYRIVINWEQLSKYIDRLLINIGVSPYAPPNLEAYYGACKVLSVMDEINEQATNTP